MRERESREAARQVHRGWRVRNKEEVVRLWPNEGGGEGERGGRAGGSLMIQGGDFGVLSETRAMEGSEQRGGM